MKEDPMTSPSSNNILAFYESINRDSLYTVERNYLEHPFYPMLISFIERWDLKHKKCLEIGSSKGLFQNIVADYTGVDIAVSLSSYYKKPYLVVNDAHLPFPDNSFDAVFTYATHEHIPDLETALNEIIRILKPGGVCLLAPAWHTRSWFAEGLAIRPYSSLRFEQKIRKFFIPVRDFAAIRYPVILLRRFYRLIQHFQSPTHTHLKYKKLDANYETFWQSDSDACNSIDPFDMILWFRKRGFTCQGFNNLLNVLMVRTYCLDLQKPLNLTGEQR